MYHEELIVKSTGQVKSKKLRAKIKVLGLPFAFLLLTSLCAVAQSGGQFAIQKTVVAGGGEVMSGGQFGVTATAGQAAAGIDSSTPPFGARSGFWQNNLVPTAAHVPVSGRVLTGNGSGLRNATVRLTNSSGVTVAVRTSSFGYYRFNDVAVGETYVVNVNSKRFTFASRIVTVIDELTDIDFVAETPE